VIGCRPSSRGQGRGLIDKQVEANVILGAGCLKLQDSMFGTIVLRMHDLEAVNILKIIEMSSDVVLYSFSIASM
jgi:hypothetical protein